MKFEQNDIEKSKSHLLALIENENLNIDLDKIDYFINFICIDFDQQISDKKNLLQTLQSFSYIEILDLYERFKIEEEEIDNLIYKSFKIEKRNRLKNKLIQLEKELEESLFDEYLTKAFQLEKREKLKQKLKEIEDESITTGPKIVSMRPFLKAISIAASIILILMVWQPQHLSDKKIFADYTKSIDNTFISDFAKDELVKQQGGLRGDEEKFRNYNYDESLLLLEAIDLVKKKEFARANEVFKILDVRKEKNPGLALYLSISQLNTEKFDDAINNLEYLVKINGFLYHDEAKFHLAFAYLKTGERKKAKTLFHELVDNKSKFANQAKQILKKMRWF